MKQLYVNYKGVDPEGDALLSAPDDVDRFLDDLRTEVGDAGALLMMIGFAGDESDDAPMLQAGINLDKGLLTYDGNGEGLLSYAGRAVRGTVYYSFQGTKAEFPASAEIPYASVKQAIREFLTSGGALPTCLEWRPDVD